MKKITLALLVLSSFIFANTFKGCYKTDISENERIFSCPTGDYRVIYKNSDKEKVIEFMKIGEPAKIIQNIYRK